jgi:hypothetical protein
VCAGIARNYGWDVNLVRLAFVVASIFGFGIPVYVVAWIVIPLEADTGTAPGFGPERRETGPLIGLALLGIGLLWLGGRLVPDRDFADIVWPLTLIAGGLAVLVLRAAPDAEASDEATGPTFAAPAAPPAAAPVGAVDVTEPTLPVATPAPTSSAWGPAAPWPTTVSPRDRLHARQERRDERRRSRAARRPRSFLAPLTLSVLLVFAGVIALLSALDAVDLDALVVGAIALGIVGVALVVSAWFGHARGLVGLAVPLTIALGILAAIDAPFAGGIGDRDHHPQTAAQLEPEYRLAIGQMTLDLRDVQPRPGITEVEASVAIGELVVLVPDDVTVDVRAEAGIGEVDVFGEVDGGTSVERTDIARAGAPTLRLDLRTGIGRVAVEQFRTGTEVLR